QSLFLGDLRQQLFAELITTQIPTTPDRSEFAFKVSSPTLLDEARELFTTRGAVLGNAPLAKEPADAQPRGAFGWWLKIKTVAAPAIGLQRLIGSNEYGSHRIEVDVIADPFQVAGHAAVHRQSFIATAEQVAKQLVATIEAARVSSKKPLHAGRQVGLRGLQNEMKMIFHQTVSVDEPLGL